MRSYSTVATACLLFLVGCSKTSAPLAPWLYLPTVGQRGDTIRGTVTSFDKDHDSLYYLVDWGDGSPPVWAGPAASAADCDIFHVYSDTGDFGVVAKAKDSTRESGWSDTFYVLVIDYTPSAPTRPAGPDSVKVGDTATYHTAAGDPLSRRVSIQFDWGDTLGDWGPFIAPNEPYFAPHAFSRAGTMLVRARARDSLEHFSNWSDAETVRVTAAKWPSPDSE